MCTFMTSCNPCLWMECVLQSPWKRVCWGLENPGVWSLQFLESPRLYEPCTMFCTWYILNHSLLSSGNNYTSQWWCSVAQIRTHWPSCKQMLLPSLSHQTRYLTHSIWIPLIFDKIIKILATRCQTLRLKCSKFDFGWGSTRYPAVELTVHPSPPIWI